MGNVNLNAGFSDADTLDGVHLSSIYADRNVITDCNDAILPGTYAVAPPYTNAPLSHYGLLTVHRFSGGWILQEFKQTRANNRKWFRQNINNEGWSDWNEFSSDHEYRNIADNPTFAINQRLQTNYVLTYGVSSGPVFCADRWHISASGLDNGATVTATTYTNGGLGIVKSCERGAWWILQTIEPVIYDTYLVGQRVSVRVSTDAGIISGSLVVPDRTTESAQIWHNNGVACNIYYGAIRIFSALQSVNIYSVQLELGEHGINTQCIPDLNLELTKCKRYYQRLCRFRAPMYLYSASTRTAYWIVNFPSMRNNPTATILPDGMEIDGVGTTPSSNGFSVVWAVGGVDSSYGFLKVQSTYDEDIANIRNNFCLKANTPTEGIELSADI